MCIGMLRKSLVTILVVFILSPLIFPAHVCAYDDYESWYVDPQNPEVQRIIRQVCRFPLENNLIFNARALFYALGWRFTYCHICLDNYSDPDCHAWQTIPEMVRQDKGVCCDFARLYYSLLRGIGWPAHRIEIVWGPLYNPLTGNFIDNHAWVEIKTPSPSGTTLALSANQSISTLEGEQFVMGFNDTLATWPRFTKARIQEIQSLGFFTRDGWIPIDPTVAVEYPWFPFLFDLYLTFGYGMFLGMVHLNEVKPYYGPWGVNPRRENPAWDNFTISLEPQESFNVSYLHDIEHLRVRTHISGAVNSTLPIDFAIRNPKMELIDTASDVTTYSFYVDFDEQLSPPFPGDLGIYWFSVYNPQPIQVNVTFDAFSRGTMLWIGGDETINETIYNQYSAPSTIIPCNQSGNFKNTFLEGEDVYAKGWGYPPNTEVAIYVVPDGYDATPSNAETVAYETTESDGTLAVTPVWSRPLDLGNYDIWVDVNQNNIFDDEDTLNDQAIDVFAFNMIPEPTTIISLLLMVGAFIALYLRKKEESG